MNIISFLSSWLKDIVVLFILITIAELALPNGKMKKYINLVIGLLIIFIVISPITRLLNLDFDLDKAVMNYVRTDEAEIKEIEEFYQQQEKQIQKMYKEKIINEIKSHIEERTDFQVAEIEVNILDEEENYGLIDNLVIVLGNPNMNNEDKVAIKKVQKIVIDETSNKDQARKVDYIEIKNLIYEEFSVEKDRITIKMEKGLGE